MKRTTVIVAVTGSIAAYKALDVVRGLVGSGLAVRVVMTPSATRFVSPLSFESVTGQPTVTDLFGPAAAGDISHTALAEAAGLLVVVPATANVIAKAASGIGDDAVSATLLSVACPVLFVPAMHANMYLNPATQRNIETLRGFGCRFIGPDVGALARGDVGIGRMVEPERVVAEIQGELERAQDRREVLSGVPVLVTAGRTEEPLDPVRYLSNRASGRTGYAIASALRDAGADVILISGPSGLPAPTGVRVLSVQTAEVMRDAVLKEFDRAKAVVMTAAVSDFRPVRAAAQKIKKTGRGMTLELEENPDILGELGVRKGDRILVGFAAETQDVAENARAKLAAKNLDLVVATDVAFPETGFGSERLKAFVISAERDEDLGVITKVELANVLIDRLAVLLSGKKSTRGHRRQA